MAKKKNSTRRLLYVIGGLVAVLLIVIVAFSLFFKGDGGGTEVETAEAEIRTVTQVVTSSGNVQPEVEVIISPDVSGEVIQLPVKEGDPVRRGMLLARIKPDFYAAQVEQVEANVMQNKAILEQRRADMLNAEADLKRQQSLFERKVVAEAALETAQTRYDVAKAAFEAAEFSVQSTQASLRETREQLSKTVLYAPMDGTISQLNIELGERVVGTGQMAGTEMMRIARLDQMELEVDVNENDVVNVSLGDTASIEIDAYPEQAFNGVVTEIANSARMTGAGTQEQVTNFPVKVRILDAHNADARAAAGSEAQSLEREIPLSAQNYPNFRPGMSGTVDIFTKTALEVVTIPIQAVTVRDFNQMRDRDSTAVGDADPLPVAAREDLRKVVFIMEEGKAQPIEVETGIADDLFIEVKSGLQSGATVITGPYRVVSRTLRPGMNVKKEDPRSTRRGPPTEE